MRVARGRRPAAPMTAREDERMRPDLPDTTDAAHATELHATRSEPPTAPAEGTALPGQQPCPRCGHPMPDLKGGTASICGVCGFKDSCCF
jgi:hypothetical protein